MAAVRVLADGPAGLGALLGEAWTRYGIPLAATEDHLGAAVEEQIRWLVEAQRAMRAGADVRAVTVWALVGSSDWSSPLTHQAGLYEPGCFDVRGGAFSPTALAPVARALATGQRPVHAALCGPGWWRRPERLAYPPYEAGVAALALV